MTDHDAVLFDLDGVLVDSRVPFARGVNHALTSHGLAARPERELHQCLGPPFTARFVRWSASSRSFSPNLHWFVVFNGIAGPIPFETDSWRPSERFRFVPRE